MDILNQIITYSQDKPLLFTQLVFWAFFFIVLVFYSFVYKVNKLRTIYLLAVSLFFYFKTSGVFVILLLFTICSDYFWGKKIHKSSSPLHRKLFLTVSVILNLALLCYFKYAYFFTESFNQITGDHVIFHNHFAQFSNTFFSTHFSVDKLLLPVGVSFFTFQSLSYTIDLYRGKVEPVKSIFDYGFFVCFFPHLVAGPIVKAHDFIYQIYEPYKLERKEFGLAFFWIINGFCKKIIADYIAVNYIDRIFDNPNFYTGIETIIGIFAYSLQIYMDFSGYTDMAIGIALILGFRLKMNFNSPYKATSTSEFWKRWHISLSTWLQEYLYIPLGGNRKGTLGSYLAISILIIFLVLLSGKLWLILVFLFIAILLLLIAYFSSAVRKSINTNINLMVTMLLGGLWHGSSWLFIIWGGLNGLGLIAHKLWKKISPFRDTQNLGVKIILMLLTLTFISFTRIFFRSSSLTTVEAIFDRIKNHMGSDLIINILSGYKFVFALVILGYLIHWLPERMKESYRTWFASRSFLVMGILAIMAIFLMYQLMSGEMQPFIYFQF
ncbi:membrane-bound O-acyltransferase family protein [Sphingobacteriaceae bacterium]|nr:membrane-bound O-acyltransferase family protein [Sphingobacteriaceae bacterium]